MINHLQDIADSGVFRDYEGVIIAVQLGLIGLWGNVGNVQTLVE